MHKRSISLFLALCVLLSGILFRTVSVSRTSYSEAGTGYSSKTLQIGVSRGNIYDCRMNKLVGDKTRLVCAAKCGAYSLAYIKNIKDKKKAEMISSQLTKGLPVLFEVNEKISNDDMETFEVPVRYSESDSLCHVIGYTDSSSHGVSGIEKAFDTLLSEASGKLSVTFQTDANGRVLSGIVPTVNDDNYCSQSGVILSIDKEIQKIAEKAMDECGIENGACVMLSALDGGISAMVSRPAFSRDDIASALKSENAPLLNKALCAYSVGSVFKPVIAACALENDIETDFGYNCSGETDIGNVEFICNKRTAHGQINLKGALEQSCNTYFVNLSKRLTPEMLIRTCTDSGFSVTTNLCGGLECESGTLPDEKELKNGAAKANLSFGQGGLTATPVQMAAAYLAIADGGTYKYPYLIKGMIDCDGKLISNELKPESRIYKKSTCDKLTQDLVSVIENGNAYRAQSPMCTCAGKTGTAQSGSFDDNGKEILRTWFVGFFPANEPLFSVAILSEDGQSGASDCAPVFSLIASRTMELMIKRAN